MRLLPLPINSSFSVALVAKLLSATAVLEVRNIVAEASTVKIMLQIF
jgi:hypothetical protein